MQMHEGWGRHCNVLPQDTACSPNFWRIRSSARESRWGAGNGGGRFVVERQLLGRRLKMADLQRHAPEPNTTSETTKEQTREYRL